MNAKRLPRWLALAATATLLPACSGGIDVSIGGNGNAIVPSLPPVQDSEAVVSRGEISGSGGITVNGVHYQTGSVAVTVNGNAGSISDLRQGMVVTLTGRINDDGVTGSANSVRFAADVIGPVDGVDAANRQLVVMGQSVAANADTRFGGGIDPATWSGLAVGDVVQVSGHADASGAIRATRIDPVGPGVALQLIGTVTDLDLANLRFRIDRLTVDYSNALVIDLPGGAPANGMDVMVFGTRAAGRFAVERIVAAPAVQGNTGQRVQAAGLVTRFGSVADFDIDRLNVRAGTATAYSNGNSSDLAPNAEVVVDGNFASTGRIEADRITFGHIADDTVRLAFGFRDFTEIFVPSVFHVTVIRGPDFSAEVFVDRGHEGRVQVTQAGSRLTIALLPGNGSIRMLEAVVTMPVLQRMDLSGVALASLHDFDQPQMTINVGGVSFLRGYGLRIGSLNSTVTGVSRMDLVDVRPIGNATIDIGGVSQATLNMGVGAMMTGSVQSGQGTGASALFYYGTNVDVNVTKDSLSSIVWLGDTRP